VDRSKRTKLRVHLKPNQQLKYLNDGSAHTPACFKAITTGVYKRLASLTSVTNENKACTLEHLYPKHFEALRKADLIKDKVSTLEEELDKKKEKTEPSAALKKKREKDRKRSIFFCVGYSDFWRVPILRVILKLRKKYNLKWLRVAMSYHRFTNVRETFQADLSSKLTDGLVSMDFECLKCNCNTNKGKNGFCKYDNCCREQVVVYQAECLLTGKCYIGNTQNHLKIRMQQHTTDIQRLYLKGVKSDSYAKHFTALLPQGHDKLPAAKIRELLPIQHSILWRGKAISTVKHFGSSKCILCAKERTEIVKRWYLNPELLMNSCDEFYGACRHRAHFHRFRKQPPASTDDCDITHEKSTSQRPSPTTPHLCSSVALATGEKNSPIDNATEESSKHAGEDPRAGMTKIKHVKRKPLHPRPNG
jgi:hypothetical protein